MLAIIIPYYKKAFFKETLQSLANQTDKRFKVYVGDDASHENPMDLLEEFQGEFDFVYHRFDNNLGGTSLTKQWERCIDLSDNEEWLMILGDDDFLGNTVVASWYENYNVFCNKTEVIRFATKMIIEETQTVSDVFRHPVWEPATESFYRKFEDLSRSSLSEYIFSRATYLNYGFHDYPLAWNSDDHAWLCFSSNKPIYSINGSVIFVRISDLNISGKKDNVSIKNLSAIKFYKFLVLKKLKFYNKQQRERLLRRYEIEIKSLRNLKLLDWFLLLLFYLKYFEYHSFKKFSKRFLNSILKKHES